MALEIPDSASEIDNRAKTDVQRELQGSNPWGKNHWLGALVTAFSNRIFDLYLQLQEAIDQNMPDTASGTYLDRWKAIFKISNNVATSASGNVVATGTLGNDIPIGTIVANEDSNTYTSTATATITSEVINVDTITRSGSVVTVSFLDEHGLASGLSATIAGSAEDEFNATWNSIVVISDTAYTFSHDSGADDTGGTATSTSEYASVPIQADDTGADWNLDNSESVTLETPISGIDNTLTTDYGAVGGGADEESDDDSQDRLNDRIQNPVAHFNPSDIDALARTVNDVTRVFVQTPTTATTTATVNLTRMDDGSDTNVAALATIASGSFSFITGQEITITNSDQSDFNIEDAICNLLTSTTLMYAVGSSTQNPAGSSATIEGSDVPTGTCKVYFMRDNDVDSNGDYDPFPTASEVATVNDLLQGIRPANTAQSEFPVAAPTEDTIVWVISNISPNTESMKNAIKDSIRDMIVLRTSVGLGIAQEVYEAAIANTYDEDNAVYLESYTIDSISSSINGAVSGDIEGTTGSLQWSADGDTTFV